MVHRFLEIFGMHIKRKRQTRWETKWFCTQRSRGSTDCFVIHVQLPKLVLSLSVKLAVESLL